MCVCVCVCGERKRERGRLGVIYPKLKLGHRQKKKKFETNRYLYNFVFI